MPSFNPRTFTEPDALKTISPQRLVAFFSRWRSHLESRGISFPASEAGSLDCDQLAKVLMSPDAALPLDMVDALYHVHELSSHEDMDALLDLAKKHKVALPDAPEATTTDVAIDMWVAAPLLLKQRFAESVALRQQNFFYYGGSGKPEDLSSVAEATCRAIEKDLDTWFAAHRRGTDCRLTIFPFHRGRIGILIRHGKAMVREASHPDDIAFYRPRKHDVLVYDPSADDIAVQAETVGEHKLYLAVLGRHLFGDERHFPSTPRFTLKPLAEHGASSLACEDVSGLERIRLVEFRRHWGGAHKELEIRKATDIFAALASRDQTLGQGGRLVAAVFKVKFADSPKERSVTIRLPSNAKYERNEDSALIDAWLSSRGFAIKPLTPHAPGHDEVEVLASAG